MPLGATDKSESMKSDMLFVTLWCWSSDCGNGHAVGGTAAVGILLMSVLAALLKAALVG